MRKKFILSMVLALTLTWLPELARSQSFPQVTINSVSSDALLVVDASDPSNPDNNEGILVPRVSVLPAVPPPATAKGLLVFLTSNTAAHGTGFYYWDGISTWQPIGAQNLRDNVWQLQGNAGTNPATNFLGTTDTVALAIRTANTVRMYIDESGRVGIGTTVPNQSAQLHISSTSRGVLMPNLTTAQRDAISAPANSLLIYNTDEQCYNWYDSTRSQWDRMNCIPINVTVITPSCSTANVQGSYTQGVPLNAANMISYIVTVATPGPYSISATANGMTFTGSGTFASAGTDTITLTGTGTPSMSGFTYLNVDFGNGNTCSTPINVLSSVATISSCPTPTITGTITTGAPSTATLTLNTPFSAPGIWTINYTSDNGLSLGGTLNGTLTNPSPNVLSGINITGTPGSSGITIIPYVINNQSCSLSVPVTTGPSRGTVNCGGALSGTYTSGTAMTAANTKVVIVTASVGGTYTITTPTVNGIYFSGSGTIPVGTSNITLTASGTPTVTGTFTYTVNFSTSATTFSTCTFNVTFGGSTPIACPANLSLTFPQTATIAGQPITIHRDNTSTLSSTGTTTLCGVSSYNTQVAWTGAAGATSSKITYYFGQPIKNVDFDFSKFEMSSATFTAKNGTTDVSSSLSLTPFGSSCSSSFTVSGTTISRVGSTVGGTHVEIGSSTYFNQLTMTLPFGYTMYYSVSACNAVLDPAGAGAAITPCATAASLTFPQTVTISGTPVTITRTSTSGSGSYLSGGAAASGCGVSTTASNGSLLNCTAAGSVTYTFNHPVKDIELGISQMTGAVGANHITVTAMNGATPVTPVLSTFGGTCNADFSISGNQLVRNYPSLSSEGTYLRIGTPGTYYTSITISSPANSSFTFKLNYCNASSL